MVVSSCYQTDGGGEQRGRGWFFFFFNLPSLPNTLYLSRRENPPSSRGSEDEERKVRNGPSDHPTPPLQPPLLPTEARAPPHLKSAWSLGKEMELGEEHKVGIIEISLPCPPRLQ